MESQTGYSIGRWRDPVTDKPQSIWDSHKFFDDTVYYLKKLLLEPDYARRLGINGRANVKNNFLITRHIRDA